jgi:hypothetical protein
VRLTGLTALLSLLAAASPAAVVSSATLGYRGEPGVESKLLVTVDAQVSPARFLELDAGLSFNLFQNIGLGEAGLGLSALLWQPAGLALTLAGQHQQWSDWRAGENRVLATLEAGPVLGIEAGFGLVRRVPVFGDQYGSPFVFAGGAAEWNFLYRLRWTFMRKADRWIRVGFSSYDQYTAHSPQQFPFEADGAYRLREDVELVARAGTAIVGYSGGMVALHEVDVGAGVKYAF